MALLAWITVIAMVAGAIAAVVGLEFAIRTRDDVGRGLWVPAAALLAGTVMMLGPAALAKVEALWRYTTRLHVAAHSLAPSASTTLLACEPWRARLVQDTRTILDDMNRLAAAAAWWPCDSASRRKALFRSWGLGESRGFADFTTVNQITRDVWDWLRSVEGLPDAQRRDLADRGIEVEPLRNTLLADGDFHQRFISIAHRLRAYERGLSAGLADPFRGSAGIQHRSSSASHPSAMPRAEAGSADRKKDPPGASGNFQSLLANHGAFLRRVAAQYARSPADVDDLYQDMLFAVWRALPQFKEMCSLGTYVRRIAHSTAIDYTRRYRGVGPEVELEALDSDPEARLCEQLAREHLRKEVGLLPKRLREVMVAWLEGHDYRAIAAAVGIEVGNVGARLTRARARLRHRIAEESA